MLGIEGAPVSRRLQASTSRTCLQLVRPPWRRRIVLRVRPRGRKRRGRGAAQQQLAKCSRAEEQATQARGCQTGLQQRGPRTMLRLLRQGTRYWCGLLRPGLLPHSGPAASWSALALCARTRPNFRAARARAATACSSVAGTRWMQHSASNTNQRYSCTSPRTGLGLLAMLANTRLSMGWVARCLQCDMHPL